MGEPAVDYYKEVDELAYMLHKANYNLALDIYADIAPNCAGLKELNFMKAELGKRDRFFLLVEILRRPVVLDPWLFERCREVEANPDGHLDLWAREHYKSTIITFAGAIQEIINNPEITIGIFSHSKSISRAFLDQIKQECEQNEELCNLYPDIFWGNPKREAPTWSLDKGIVVRRQTNPKEKTVEGHGLVDGQPISKHFGLMIYDDVVTEESVNTPDMIIKTTKMWELSRSLSSKAAEGKKRRTWYIGTRYNYADTYKVILDRKVVTPRIYAATNTGTKDGKPVFFNDGDWAEKVRENSNYTLACQYLQNPVAGDQMEFNLDWIRRYEIRPQVLNVCITVDGANSKKKGSSRTAFSVTGIDVHYNKYFLDGACHRMNLSERWTMLKNLRKTWVNRKGVQTVKVGYERFGYQCDIEHFKTMMKIEGHSFHIEEVNWPREGNDSKIDRIRRLIPDHQNWRFFYPYEGQHTKLMIEMEAAGKGQLVARPIKRVNEDGRVYNLVDYLIHNEYLFFPATTMLDLLDAMSRFYDMKMNPPRVYKESDTIPEFAGQT